MTESCLPDPKTPLYNHPLPQIEQWLYKLGCHQDSQDLHLWRVERDQWKAEIWLDIEELSVLYVPAASTERDIQRTFKYSLSRQDIEDAVFSGP